jgi:hypothetical protein
VVGLAVLSLLSDVAEDRPITCLVDDAHWLDHASAQALAFAARRLMAESVAMAFAVRRIGRLAEHRGRGGADRERARRHRRERFWSWPSPVRSTSGCANGSWPRRAETQYPAQFAAEVNDFLG